MKYKVGDRVRIKSLDWYNKNKSKRGNISFPYEAEVVFTSEMSSFCGQIVTISQKGYTQDVGFYRIKEDRGSYMWTDEMIEGLVEEETKPKFKVGDRVIVRDASGIWEITNVEDNILYTIKRENHTFTLTTYGGFLTLYEGISDKMIESKVEEGVKNWADVSIPDGPYTVTYDSPSKNDSMSKNNIHNEIVLPNGYIFKDENGNVINAQKIVLEKKKKEYPKTYEECCEIFQYNKNLKVYPPFNADIPNYDALHLFDLLEALRKLLICRDAYWKIAGEEMGLKKPWEPNWTSFEGYPAINMYRYQITLSVAKDEHHFLVFPSAEMRDAFYENFKEEIEICKELL